MRDYKLTHDAALSQLQYNPASGVFIWRERTPRAGMVAGNKDSHGHRQIVIAGETILAHRLAWLMVHGKFPSHHIDHINGNRDDNRIANLRLATRAQNNSNCKLRKDNSIGLKGVARHGQRFRAQIQSEGKKRLLGVFATPEEAHAAYTAAAKILHGEFARTK